METSSPKLRVGVVCEPVSGHLNPALTIGRALRARGHAVVVFGIADVEAAVLASGLDWIPVGEGEFPNGALSSRWLAHPRGARAVAHSVALHTEETRALCRDVPDRARELGIDVLVVDQLHVCGRFLADVLGVPLVTICAGPGLLELADGSFPPPFLDRAPAETWRARRFNKAAFASMSAVAAPRLWVTNRYAARRGTPRVRSLRRASSDRLQISALVPSMNFGVSPPEGHPMRLVGPIVDGARPPVDFPWDRLDGRPVVYASLGTVQRGADELRSMIVDACRELPVQLVLSHGGADTPTPGLGDVIAVHDAPQLDLLAAAAVCITHCGMNTTMEAVAHGVPIVGLPIVYDQPAVAARVRAAGVGLTVPAARATVDRLVSMLDRVLEDGAFRRRAEAVAEECRRAPGAAGAAEMIEAEVDASRQ